MGDCEEIILFCLCLPFYTFCYGGVFCLILIGLIFAFVIIPPISIMILLCIVRESTSDKLRISRLFEKKEDVRADPSEQVNYTFFKN
jgi:uncharacterized membrane protein